MFTLAEVASKLRITRPTLAALIARGDLRALRVGKQYRIDAADIEMFIQRHQTKEKVNLGTDLEN